MKVPARADLLKRSQIAALVMHAGQAVADKLLRDVREPVTFALSTMLRRKRWPLSHAVEDVACAVGHSAVQLTIRIAIEGAAGRIRCFFGYPRQLQRLAVVKRRVPAAMSDNYRVLGRHLVEVM